MVSSFETSFLTRVEVHIYTHMNHHTSCLSEKLFCLRELCSDFVLFFLASLCYLVSVACNVLEREMGLFNTLVRL